MKKNLILFIFLLFPIIGSAQQVDEKSQKMIDEFIKNVMVSNSVAIGPGNTTRVFTGKFFITELEGPLYPGGDQGRRPYNHFIFNITDNTVTEFGLEYDKLIQLVRKDFMLKNEASALLFEKALYSFYPVRDDVKKIHEKQGNDWRFIATDGGAKRVWVVTVTPAGKISKIGLKMES
jgi:hypothetical protein